MKAKAVEWSSVQLHPTTGQRIRLLYEKPMQCPKLCLPFSSTSIGVSAVWSEVPDSDMPVSVTELAVSETGVWGVGSVVPAGVWSVGAGVAD